MQERLYIHSPFSEANASHPGNPPLLLSFVLKELFLYAKDPLVKAKDFSAFGYQNTPYSRLYEHIELLPFAFPLYKTDILQYQTILDRSPREFFLSLEPLIKSCKNFESFLFFLIKSYDSIEQLSFEGYFLSLFNEMHPEGLQYVKDMICDYFFDRGFAYLIPEIAVLLSSIYEKTK